MELLQLEYGTCQYTLPLRTSLSSILLPELKCFRSPSRRDQTGNMVIQVAVLLLLVTQVLSAPTGCIESCTSSHFKQYYTSGNLQDHGLQAASQLQGPEYSKPGTWSEHNEYNVDNGHGKVHEERGQYVAGPKTVRYFKKNYTSSYSTHSNGDGLSNVGLQSDSYRHGAVVPSVEDISSIRRDHVSSSQSQHRYNSMHQPYMQSSIRTSGSRRSERLEDFGEYHVGSQQSLLDVNSQTSQVPRYDDARPGNWSTVDSYKTDGGRGRVFHEEGQYQTGGKKVRYYKKNYTSSYSSHGEVPDVPLIGVPDIHENLERIQQEIQKHINQASSVEKANTYGSSNLRSSAYGGRTYDSSSLVHQNEEQIRDSTSEHSSFSRPAPSSYGSSTYSAYERHEGHVAQTQPTHQVINPTSGYTNVLSTGNSGYAMDTRNTGITQQHLDSMQMEDHLNTHRSRHNEHDVFVDNLRQHELNTMPRAASQVSHYKKVYQASSETKATSVPQYHTEDYNMQYSNRYHNRHGAHQTVQSDNYANQLTGSSYNSAYQTQVGTGSTIGDLTPIGVDTVDCGFDTQHIEGNHQHQRKYKRSVNYDQQSDTQQHEDLEQLTQQTGNYEDLTQQTSQHWKPGHANQFEDLTQQTNDHDDFTQQTTGNLEYGQPSRRPWNQQSQDLTQQTSGKLEFGHESQQTSQPWKPNSANQYGEDLTQQTSGNLEYGQHSRRPWNQQSEDLTQQTSGNLEFGHESQQTSQPWKPNSANQYGEDLTQQTSGNLEYGQHSRRPWNQQSEDLTQQTLGKLEFGQESQQRYQHWKRDSTNAYGEDLTQQTDDQDDLMQQTSGKLQLDQDSQQSSYTWNPMGFTQYGEDLTQQTDDHDDLTQQTSGKLQFGQDSQQSSYTWSPVGLSQYGEDLTQQTDDLTQQTSGNIEFGQYPSRPWNQYSEDLTQQTSGKLEFGHQTQQSSHPGKPSSASQYVDDLTQLTNDHDDLTQQTDDHGDFTQQTSGNIEFGQHPRRPWNQHSEDLTQQTSGKLEFGHQTQQSSHPGKPSSTSQYVDDLTQLTNDHDDLTQQADDHGDLTQQTSGNIEFGQQPRRPWKQHSEDLTQQTSGQLEFGHQTQQTNDHGDLIQQTDDHGDLTQQTSGNIEFGQHPRRPWNQHSEDLTQQTSGKLEFGHQTQQSSHPGKPSSTSQYVDDLTQLTNDHDDLTQQTDDHGDFTQQTGNLELGQESQGPWDQYSDDLIQQTSGNLEFGQQSHHPWNQYSDDFTQKTSGNLEFGQQTQTDIDDGGFGSHTRKPAPIPTPKPRYSRVIVKPMQVANNEVPYSVGEENSVHKIESQDLRGDQGESNLNLHEGNNGYQVEGENADQAHLLHKSNDAMVGLQWHYTFHPSDQRQFVSQTGQKSKEDVEQQTSSDDFSDLQQSSNQQVTREDLAYLHQSSDQDNGELQLAKLDQATMDETQQQDYLPVDQQAIETENQQKHIRNSDTERQLEPRILQAYGGGPYDGSFTDDIYHGITAKPSVTLPPVNKYDSWDIREKPVTEEATELYPPPMPVEPLSTDFMDEPTPPPNFWSRFRNKITNTFDKAKERARNIFG